MFALRSANLQLKPVIFRSFTQQSKDTAARDLRARIGQAAAPVIGKSISTAPLTLGRGLLAGASVLGLGALGFYGLGFSKELSIADKQAMWPSYVRERIRSTYEYFGAGLGLTTAAVMGISRNPAMMRVLTKNTMLSFFGSLALLIGSSMLVRSIPHEQIIPKHMAWLGHLAIVGAVIAPISLLGPALLVRAAWYTAGIVGGLTVVAATAPSEKFLFMTAPLGVALGTVLAASVGSMFISPASTLGLGLYSVWMYGGLVLFSAFLLYDTQRIVHKAENNEHFDHINESMGIYMDVINIFIRIAMMLGGGGKKK